MGYSHYCGEFACARSTDLAIRVEWRSALLILSALIDAKLDSIEHVDRAGPLYFQSRF